MVETYLKALLKCVPRAATNDRQMVPIKLLSKLNKKTGAIYTNSWLYCLKKLEDEHKDMYQQARIFMAYEGALSCGRDQAWWFEQVASTMGESAEYWAGRVPNRVQYEMSVAEPLRYPNTYVYWQNRIAFFKAKHFVVKNKYWLAALTITWVI